MKYPRWKRGMSRYQYQKELRKWRAENKKRLEGVIG